MEGRCRWSYYEFGSFVNEVALRALLGKPFIKHNMDITGDLKVETKGSGCQATIDFLTASQLDLFNTYKQRFQQQLEEWDRRHAGTKIPTAKPNIEVSKAPETSQTGDSVRKEDTSPKS